ncbi:MAG: DEAD/DEAH box helicase [Sandaracinaceae bacterium]
MIESAQLELELPARPAVAPPAPVRPTPCLRLSVEAVVEERPDGATEVRPLPVLALAFDYRGCRVAAADPSPHVLTPGVGAPVLLPRNPEAERRARCLLEGFGAVDLDCLEDRAVAPGSEADYLLRTEGDAHAYCAFGAWVVPQLRRLGWQVEVDPAYPYQVIAEEPRWYAEVGAVEGRPDWFALELGVDLDGRQVNLLPALVSLLEGAEEESLRTVLGRARCLAVPLPDGRFLPLPTERARAILRVVGELYGGSRATPEALTLTRLGAGALGHLDQEFDEDELRWADPAGLRTVGRALVEGPPPTVPREHPGGLRATLRPYQQVGVEWLQRLRAMGVGGILADDMGLGKTLQTIAHLALEKAEGRLERPALVVAPTSLTGNWKKELSRFAPHLRVLRLTGPRRHERLGEPADVAITSYPCLVRDVERLQERSFSWMVLDEAHVIKNSRSQAHQAAKAIDAEHRLCLTGTPVENHLGELWALFDFLEPGLLADELTFRRAYRVPIERYGDEERLAALRQRVAPYLLRRLKQEVATELPPKTELLRPVTMGKAQRELYESIRVAAHGEVRRLIRQRGLAASTVPILGALTKLRQVCCDPRLLPMRSARRVRESAKTSALFELLDAQLGRGHRVLVFSQFTTMLHLIARSLEERSVRFLLLDGSTKDRQGLVEAFEGGAADVFLISLKAGGVGLTLTRADTVIHVDPWWNPAAQDQATDRAYRIGQTRPVVAHSLFVAGSVEERMLALQRRKRRIADGLLAGGTGLGSLTEDDVEALLAPLG